MGELAACSLLLAQGGLRRSKDHQRFFGHFIFGQHISWSKILKMNTSHARAARWLQVCLGSDFFHSSKKTDGFRMVSDPNKYHGQTYPEKHGKIMKNLWMFQIRRTSPASPWNRWIEPWRVSSLTSTFRLSVSRSRGQWRSPQSPRGNGKLASSSMRYSPTMVTGPWFVEFNLGGFQVARLKNKWNGEYFATKCI